MDRRHFLQASMAAWLTGITDLSAQPAADNRASLRVITYNILACRGYPDTKENRARLNAAKPQMIRRVAQELQLYAPDIVTFQESPFEDVVAGIAQEMGMEYAFFPGGWPGNDDWPGGFPGTVMSRYPIVEKENCPLHEGERPEDLFTRHWGRAVIDLGATKLPVYTVHLHPSKADIRAREVTEILNVLAPDIDAGTSFLFQGDFNHKPNGPEYGRWLSAGLQDSLVAKGDANALTFAATIPKVRIDYIWTHGELSKRLTQCRVLFEGAFRTNPDDPTSFALSDHLPVMAEFKQP